MLVFSAAEGTARGVSGVAMTRGPWWGRAAAVPGRRDHQGLSAGRGPAGGVSSMGWWWPMCRGASGREAHLGFRRHLRVACRPAALSVLTVLLHRVAHRGRDRGRVVADGRDTNDLLDGLTRIGIDEIDRKAPLSDLRGRPRHRPAGVGRRGP